MLFERQEGGKIFSFGADDRPVIREVAELYCQIWKEPPWNEDFWQEAEVTKDILGQMAKGASVFVAASRFGNIVGFGWGYAADSEAVRGICGGSVLEHLFEKSDAYFYLDELAVQQLDRQHGIGKRLILHLMGEAKMLGYKCFPVRTDIDATRARNLYQSLGFQDLGIRDLVHHSRTYWTYGL